MIYLQTTLMFTFPNFIQEGLYLRGINAGGIGLLYMINSGLWSNLLTKTVITKTFYFLAEESVHGPRS